MATIRLAHSGELRERVTILRATASQDEYHETTVTLTETVTRWARIQAETASERLRSGRIDARQAFIVTLRYEADLVTSDDVIRWDNAPGGARTLAVVGAPVVSDDRRFIQFTAVED